MMDKDKIMSLVRQSLTGLNVEELIFHFEEDDVIRIEIISSDFVGMRLLKRIDLVSEKLIDIAINELFDYALVYNPITYNEKTFKTSKESGL